MIFKNIFIFIIFLFLKALIIHAEPENTILIRENITNEAIKYCLYNWAVGENNILDEFVLINKLPNGNFERIPTVGFGQDGVDDRLFENPYSKEWVNWDSWDKNQDLVWKIWETDPLICVLC